MDILANIHPISLVVAGGAGLAIACLLWALRVSQTTESAYSRSQQKTRQLEQSLARADSVFSAYPGIIMVWENNFPQQDHWGQPKIFGSSMALASILRLTDSNASQKPATDRILEGIGDLEARDANGNTASLRQRIHKMREEGSAFSLTIIASSGQFLEADGRVAGSRLILWLTDATIKELSESKARAHTEETRQVLSSHGGSFLEILDKSPMPVWRLNAHGQVQWANQAYLEAVDAQSLKQIIGKDVLLDRNIARQSEKSLSEAKNIVVNRQITIGGERRTMRIVTFPISGGIGGIAQDVSKEQALREQYDRHVKAYDETLNHVADAVAIFGPDHRLYFHNRAFEELWQIEPSFLLERPDHGMFLDRLRECGQIPTQHNYTLWRAEELSHYRKQATEIEEDLWSLPDGRTLRLTRQIHPTGGLILLFQDITTELNLQARYASLLKVQAATLDNLQAVAVFGSDGKLTLYNEQFQNLWGIDPQAINAGSEFDSMVDACLRLYPDQSIWSAIKARVTDPSPEARQKFDGEMNRSDNKIVSFFTQPLPDGATLIAFKDESDARRSEELLRERANVFEAADRLKTEFVRNVSRELRSPLTTILGYSEMLQTLGELPKRMSDQVKYIGIAAEQLSQLVANILDLAMIDAGHMKLDVTEFDMGDVIGQSISMAISGAADTEVTIDVKCPSDIGSIHADEKRIRQALFNLLTNALHFTEAGDSVTVSVEKSDGVFCLKVNDTGCGVPHDKQVQAFSAFDSDYREGAGLGLALVESFVRLHGGWVAMQSEPGEGTSVLCFLPERAVPDAETETDTTSDEESDRAAA